MTLAFYLESKNISKLLQTEEQFVKIINGVKRNSIAKILKVNHINYSTHKYRLFIEKCREFWMNGKDLEHVPGYDGNTVLVKNLSGPEKVDFMGRTIVVGSTVVFSQICGSLSNTNAPNMIIATVREHRSNGSVWAQPIKIGNKTTSELNVSIMKISNPEKSLIIDRETSESVMMYKLCN